MRTAHILPSELMALPSVREQQELASSSTITHGILTRKSRRDARTSLPRSELRSCYIRANGSAIHWRKRSWTMSCAAGLPLLILTLLSAASPAEEPWQRFEQARQLEQAGKLEEAFLAYAAMPGAQHAAVRIGRGEPAAYRRLLASRGAHLPAPLVKVVEGDLHLAGGDRPAALDCYRAAAKLATSDELGWDGGRIPRDEYMVDPPETRDGGPRGVLERSLVGRPGQPPRQLADPPVHRGLESWEDAAGEFARVWKIHRRRCQPYRVQLTVYAQGGETRTEERLVRPAGFDSRGLQFALDYAFFLKQRAGDRSPPGDSRLVYPSQALAVLQEPLLALDMDLDPNAVRYLPLTGPGDPPASNLPLPPTPPHLAACGDRRVRKEFVRLAYGVFKESGQERDLVATLERRIAAGENRLRRVLARVRLHQGQMDEAAKLEFEYLEHAQFDAVSTAYRRGLIYEELGRPAEACAAFEQALALPYATRSPREKADPVNAAAGQSLRLPDPDEQVAASAMQARVSHLALPGSPPSDGPQFRAGIAQRLERLYGGLGQPDKAFAMAPPPTGSPARSDRRLCHAGTRGGPRRGHRSGGRLPRMGPEATGLRRPDGAGASQSPLDAAGLCRLPGRSGRALETGARDGRPRPGRLAGTLPRGGLGSGPRVPPGGDCRQSPERSSAAGTAGPDRPLCRPRGDRDAGSPAGNRRLVRLRRGKGAVNRTRFRNYFDLAYRLMRLYEREQQRDRLLALGLRIAAGKPPFGEGDPSRGRFPSPWSDMAQQQWRNANDLPEDSNACLALLVQQADAETAERLARVWQERPDFPAKRQLARRLAGGLARPSRRGTSARKTFPPASG